MPSFRRIANSLDNVRKEASKAVNWHPGHMYSGMQAMMGKLNTVDCVIEVHDARIPLIGRNREFRHHLGTIKPHLLVLNKRDLADLKDWDRIEKKLAARDDHNVILTDMTGTQFSHSERGYDRILDRAVSLIRESDRNNRGHISEFKVMIVGIPNVGKSTLINRLRQHHLGGKGEATRTGNTAGVTRHVENKVKICSRPLIYSIDTPGVLQPSATRDFRQSMILALCSTITDKVLKPYDLAKFLLDYLNRNGNDTYIHAMEINGPVDSVEQLCQEVAMAKYPKYQVRSDISEITTRIDTNQVCWKFVRAFREGLYGKVMFH